MTLPKPCTTLLHNTLPKFNLYYYLQNISYTKLNLTKTLHYFASPRHTSHCHHFTTPIHTLPIQSSTVPSQNITWPYPYLSILHQARTSLHFTLSYQHYSSLNQCFTHTASHNTLPLRYITKPSPNCTYFTLHLLHTTFPCIAYTPHYPTSRNNTATAPRIV